MFGEPNNVKFGKVYISLSALRTIFQESRKSMWNETGGALVGTVSENKLYVMEASGPGWNAASTTSSFSPDIRHLEEFVHYFEERGFLFVGQWHKHPLYISGPSGGDKAQVEEILKDNPHLNFFINIISNPIESGFRVSATMFFRDGTAGFGWFPRIKPVELFLENDAPLIVVSNICAEKSGSDIVVRGIEIMGEEIPPGAEACGDEKEKIVDVSVSKDSRGLRWAPYREAPSISAFYGWDKAGLLKEKILCEKKLMGILFPEFKLRVNKKSGKLFWFTVFHAHQVALTLEKDGTYTVLIDPEAEKIDVSEKVPKSALVAALIAKASILSKQLAGLDMIPKSYPRTLQNYEREAKPLDIGNFFEWVKKRGIQIGYRFKRFFPDSRRD
ncbi:MAG: hypothetical protein QW279_09470 [Candidatus Jordarchaeaceae archaeon]